MLTFRLIGLSRRLECEYSIRNGIYLVVNKLSVKSPTINPCSWRSKAQDASCLKAI